MTPKLRHCAGSEDFAAISELLFSLYRTDNRDGNWLQPIWEYAYTHPWFDDELVGRIGIWEDGGAIVGVAQHELRLGEAFFQVAPGHAHLKSEMLAHAEEHLYSTDAEGRRFLKAFVADFDRELEAIVRSRGYSEDPRSHRPMSQLAIPDPFPKVRVPGGFRLSSLAENNDLVKVDRVLWRGFDHPGEPPEDSLEGRRKMQSGPHFRKDLTIVAEDPDGDFAAFAGVWFEPVNRFGYVEPVATDPEYRGLGLGTAAVLEGIGRCGELGASVAYVGTDMPFYLAMGFRKLFTLNCWIRHFPGG